MRHDPADADWTGRDRFVLSAGHTSLTLYIQLYLAGYGLELDDLKAFRTWGSKTPGHPEYGHTTGVETTTGPLGQGVANAVGMAMAARYERGLFDPEAAPGHLPVRPHHLGHRRRRLPAGGHLRRGVLAGRPPEARQPGRCCGTTTTSPSRATPRPRSPRTSCKRYEAYGWHVQRVAPKPNGDLDPRGAVRRRSQAAQGRDRAPVVHRDALDHRLAGPERPEHRGRARLGARRRRGRRHQAGPGLRPGEVLRGRRRGPRAHPRGAGPRPRGARPSGRSRSPQWRTANPERAAEFDRIAAGELPEGWEEHAPGRSRPGKAVATRAASGKVLQALGAVIPELWGGSADLAGSNNTTIDKTSSFLPGGQPAAGAPTRTAARSTSASASTPWPRR